MPGLIARVVRKPRCRFVAPAEDGVIETLLVIRLGGGELAPSPPTPVNPLTVFTRPLQSNPTLRSANWNVVNYP